MNMLLNTFILLLVLKVTTSVILDLLNLKHVKSQSIEVPENFRDFIDEDSYRKSIKYTVAKTRFSIVSDFYDALILAVVVLGGFLPWLYDMFTGMFGSGIWGQALVLLLIGFILGVPGLPFDWWSTFKIEGRFGFNKNTLRLWILDKVKGSLIALIIGLPLFASFIFLVDWGGSFWWIWGGVVFFLFQIVIMVVHPMFIMPLFNKLEPLEEGSLKTRLFSLADRTGFNAKTILVMDGSKRSTHSNAFFAGFGKFRRIVFFDTLLEQMNEEELEAVLAHEIGHYKLGHIPKMIALSGLISLGIFALLGLLSGSMWFVEAFKFTNLEGSQIIVPLFLLFMLLSGLVNFWLTPLASLLSRKYEYEADAFARDVMKSSKPLVLSLRKLHKENLSNLTPHHVYSGFYYSHPTLMERENALASTSEL